MRILRDPTIKDVQNFFTKNKIVKVAKDLEAKEIDNILNDYYDAWEEYCEQWSIDPEGNLK